MRFYRSVQVRPLDLVLTLALLLAMTGPAAAIAPGPAPEPTLLLNPAGLADRVEPGTIFAVLGDVAIFWLDEITDNGTPDHLFDDKARFVLWRSDGTVEGTYPLVPRDISLVQYLDTLRGVLFFVACRTEQPVVPFSSFLCDSVENVELWRTDGTLAGTYPLVEKPSRAGFGNRIATVVPSLEKLFFLAIRSEGTMGVWATDGTREGTGLVKDLPLLGFDGASSLRAWDDELWFLGSKAVGDTWDLWIGSSDGTEAGTRGFRPEIPDFVIAQAFMPAGEHLFLVVVGEELVDPVTRLRVRPRTLWAMKRGTEVFEKLANLDYSTRLTSVHAVAGDGRLFLEIPEFPGQGYELWASDGTSLGTERLGRVPRFAVHGHIWTEPFDLPQGRALIALASEPTGDQEPWVTNGESEGTSLLRDLCPGVCSSFPAGMTIFGGWYYFSAEDENHGRELWRWQPATETVERVADLCPGECGAFPILADQTSDRLFVRAIDAEFRRHVWQIGLDGSAQEVTDFGDLALGGFESLFNRAVYSWRVVGDRAVFWATDSRGRLGFWSMEVPSSETVPPPGPGLTSQEVPGFSVKVRITSGSGEPVLGRREINCIPETLCVSGALEGRSEVFVRIVGPRPNGRLWPVLVKFTTSTVEVWIEQLSTGIVKYYRLEGATPGSSELPGLFDRDGFLPASN